MPSPRWSWCHGFSNWSRSREIHRFVTSCRRGPTSWPSTSAVTAAPVVAAPRGRRSRGTCAAAVGRRAPSPPSCLSWPSASAWAVCRRCSPPVGAARWRGWWRCPPRPGGTSASPAGVRLARWLSTRRGQVLLLALSGTGWTWRRSSPSGSMHAVAAIAPRFVVIVHDPQERVFGPEHAETLFAWAGEPKALWWTPGLGHGRSMLTPELAERVRREVSGRWRRDADERRRRLDQVGALLRQIGHQLPPVGHHRPGPGHAAQPVHALRPADRHVPAQRGRRGTRRRRRPGRAGGPRRRRPRCTRR